MTALTISPEIGALTLSVPSRREGQNLFLKEEGTLHAPKQMVT